MTDALREKIWDLVEPQLEAFERTGSYIDKRLLEKKVLDIIQDIELEIEGGYMR